MSSMKEPEYRYTCESCFRCVQECTKGIFSRVINPNTGHWRRLLQPGHLCTASGTRRIPARSRFRRRLPRPFVGPGFDSMWTDMSEIVRPTRDGIHGREYINTCIELSDGDTPQIQRGYDH